MPNRVSIPNSENPEIAPSWFMRKGRLNIRCACGVYASIDNSHEVTATGDVNPSVWHEELENGGCGFHALVTLEGYVP